MIFAKGYAAGAGLALAALTALTVAFLRFWCALRRLALMVLLYCFPITVFTFLAGCDFVCGTMNFCGRRFNLYLAAAVLLLPLTGCELLDSKSKTAVQLRVFLEAAPGAPGDTQTISVIRSVPVQVHVASDPLLTEADVDAARLVDTAGSFAMEVQFDEVAGASLEQGTASNPGRHLAIFGLWGKLPGESRWLAVPAISHHFAGGTLVFTPDASREEAEKLVKALNDFAKKNGNPKKKE